MHNLHITMERPQLMNAYTYLTCGTTTSLSEIRGGWVFVMSVDL